jgi:hypothetical protein
LQKTTGQSQLARTAVIAAMAGKDIRTATCHLMVVKPVEKCQRENIYCIQNATFSQISR